MARQLCHVYIYSSLLLYASTFDVGLFVWVDNSFASITYPGLNVEVDRILEIACVITDGNLTKSIEVFKYCYFSQGTSIFRTGA